MRPSWLLPILCAWRDAFLKRLEETDQTRHMTFSTCPFEAINSEPLRGKSQAQMRVFAYALVAQCVPWFCPEDKPNLFIYSFFYCRKRSGHGMRARCWWCRTLSTGKSPAQCSGGCGAPGTLAVSWSHLFCRWVQISLNKILIPFPSETCRWNCL